MIGSDILVVPDIGPDFLRALKAGSLYSVRVQTTLLDISCERVSWWLEMSELKFRTEPVLECFRPSFERISQYFRFLIDNERSLSLLTDNGILPRSSLDGLAQAIRQASPTPLPNIGPERALYQLKDSVDPQVTILQRAYAEYPPTFMDLIPLLPLFVLIDKSWAHLPNLTGDITATFAGMFMGYPELRILMFAFYLTVVSYVSERSSVAVLCTSELHQQAVWAARDLIGIANDGNLLAERNSIQAQVGDSIIQRYLPDVDSLEFEDILELRARCKDELDAFRIGLRELAVQVDTTQPIERQRLQIEDVISTKVDPAVRNLQVSLWSTRADILKKLTPSWDALAKATVPFLVSVAVGAPMNMQATLAAIGGFSAIAGPFIESEVERRKLLHASQWSFLLKLRKLGT